VRIELPGAKLARSSTSSRFVPAADPRCPPLTSSTSLRSLHPGQFALGSGESPPSPLRRSPSQFPRSIRHVTPCRGPPIEIRPPASKTHLHSRFGTGSTSAIDQLQTPPHSKFPASPSAPFNAEPVTDRGCPREELVQRKLPKPRETLPQGGLQNHARLHKRLRPLVR